MINRNELRIGNHLNHKEYGKVILEPQDFMDWNFEFVEGIPLTEQWLLKFGAKFKEDLKEYGKSYIIPLGSNDWDEEFVLEIVINGQQHCQIISLDKSGSHNCQIINYPEFVHQLQNLYHALTNEELTCK